MSFEYFREKIEKIANRIRTDLIFEVIRLNQRNRKCNKMITVFSNSLHECETRTKVLSKYIDNFNQVKIPYPYTMYVDYLYSKKDRTIQNVFLNDEKTKENIKVFYWRINDNFDVPCYYKDSKNQIKDDKIKTDKIIFSGDGKLLFLKSNFLRTEYINALDWNCFKDEPGAYEYELISYSRHEDDISLEIKQINPEENNRENVKITLKELSYEDNSRLLTLLELSKEKII